MNIGRLRFGRALPVLCVLIASASAGWAQSRDGVREALLSGSPDKAIGLALEALRADPSNVEIRFLLARA